MKTTNKVLIAVIVILVAIIGYEGYNFYSDNYGISNIKLYEDPYKKYSNAELKTMMEKGDLDATAQYGLYLIDEGNDPEAGFRLCLKAAKEGNARGENAVGTYRNDQKDYKEAFKWYSKSADQDFLYAIINLAHYYLQGRGVKQDKEKGFSLLQKASKKGLAEAMVSLGCCYLNGDGTKKDEQQAFKYFTKAAENGNKAALYELGYCYELGFGVAKDEKAAVELYEKAASQGENLAIYAIGRCYQYGTGVSKNEQKAFELYSQAANKGLSFAQGELGNCYKEGVGTKKNYDKAFEWYMKAANQGNAYAQYCVADCYWNAFGTKKDVNQVYHWAQLSAKQGCDAAKRMLQNLPTWISNEEKYEREHRHIGTFEFTDRQGHEWVLTVKEDKTATIKVKTGTSPAYASWYKYDNMAYASFRCSERAPMIVFPGSELYMNSNGVFGAEACGYFCIDGHYIYSNSRAADAKNPDQRLPLKKIK